MKRKARQTEARDPGKVRTNHSIRVRQVRLIDPDGANLGVVDTDQARDLAQEKGLDLVEVDPSSRPPICKIMDYGKFRYDSEKRKKQSKKKSRPLKTVRFRAKTDDQDKERQLDKAREFLSTGHTVRIELNIRGRENKFRSDLRDRFHRLVRSEFGENAIYSADESRRGFVVTVRPS